MGNSSACQKFEKLQKRSKTPKTKNTQKQQALKLQKTGNYTKAIKIYKNLIELNQTDPTIYYNTSICYLNLGFYENSLLYINKVKSGNPNKDDFFRLSGFLNLKIYKKKKFDKNFFEAYEDFCFAYEIDKKKNLENFFAIKKFRYFKKEKIFDKKKKKLFFYFSKFQKKKNLNDFLKNHFLKKKIKKLKFHNI